MSVVAPGADDQHPDHVEAHHMLTRACYLSGLARYPAAGERWRPARILYALYRGMEQPNVVVDITPVWEKRVASVLAHTSQVDPKAGPATYLTSEGFMAEVEARARVYGVRTGGTFGEGYRTRGPLVIGDLRALLAGGKFA